MFLTTRSWDPLGEMERMLDDMNRIFGNARGLQGQPMPAVNIYANDERLIVTSELPGLDPASIEVSVVGDTLNLRASRPAANRDDQPATDEVQREQPATAITRSLQLPFRVEAEHAEARYDKGILSIALRRPEAAKPTRIAVKAV